MDLDCPSKNMRLDPTANSSDACQCPQPRLTLGDCLGQSPPAPSCAYHRHHHHLADPSTDDHASSPAPARASLAYDPRLINKDVILFWKTVAQINEGEKVRVTGFCKIEIDKRIGQWFWRRWSGDSWEKTVEYIIGIYELTLALPDVQPRLEMQQAIPGLMNLRSTYAGDINMATRMDLIVQSISAAANS